MGFSKAVGSLFMFGFGMITIGMMISIFKGTLINRIIEMFWIPDTPFLNLMNVQYNMLALVIMVMGIICVVVAGVQSHKKEAAF